MKGMVFEMVCTFTNGFELDFQFAKKSVHWFLSNIEEKRLLQTILGNE